LRVVGGGYLSVVQRFWFFSCGGRENRGYAHKNPKKKRINIKKGLMSFFSS
jgi:hypothetical protein